MTIASLFVDLQLLGALMVLGFIIRELCRPIQNLYIPTSMLAGIIGLILGPQLAGVVEIPSSFGAMSGTLIGLVLTCIIYGISFNVDRLRNYADFTLIQMSNYGMQIFIGIPLAMLLSTYWLDLPEGWGTMGVFSFWGGHGTAGAAGAVFSELGIEGNLGMGMILSTIGLMAAIIFGMMLVNWGIRKGYAAYTKVPKEGYDPTLGGVLPENLQKPIGYEKTSPNGINGLLFQLCMILLCIFIGTALIKSVGQFIPLIGKIPALVHGMVGAMVVRIAMHYLKLDGYIDKRTVSTISGFTLDIVIISAVSTIKIDFVTTFAVPILIYSAVFIVLCLVQVVYCCKKFCRQEWFEKACCLYGMTTGAVPTGLALVRSVDPETKSSAPDAQGVGSAVMSPLFGMMPVILPPLVLSAPFFAIGIGAALFFIPLILVAFFFGRAAKVLN